MTLETGFEAPEESVDHRKQKWPSAEELRNFHFPESGPESWRNRPEFGKELREAQEELGREDLSAGEIKEYAEAKRRDWGGIVDVYESVY